MLDEYTQAICIERYRWERLGCAGAIMTEYVSALNRNGISGRRISLTPFPRSKYHRTYPKTSLRNGNSRKPDRNGNILLRHSVYPVTALSDINLKLLSYI